MAATDRRPPPFVQLAPQRLDDYCDARRLNGRDRELLAQLVLHADWRKKPHRVDAFATVSDYAQRLGFGPSGRRTLPRRLDVLAAAGAVRWSPGRPGGRPGYLDVPAYTELVGSAGGWFVQLRPGPFDRLCADRGLDVDQRGLLLRLVLAADAGIVRGAPLTISKRLRLDRTRCRRLLAQLAAAEVLTMEPGAVSIDVYAQLIEAPTGAPEARKRAVDQPPAEARKRAVDDPAGGDKTRGRGARKRAVDRRPAEARKRAVEAGSERPEEGVESRDLEARKRAVDDPAGGAKARGRGRESARYGARKRAVGGAKARGDTPSELGKEGSIEVEVYTPRPTADLVKEGADDTPIDGNQSEGKGKADQHHETLELLARQLPPDVGRALIEQPRYEGARRALTRDLAVLAERVGMPEAIASVARDWPTDVQAPAALARKRVAQRLVDAEQTARSVERVTAGPGTVAYGFTDPERAAVAAMNDADRLARVTDVSEREAIDELTARYGHDLELLGRLLERFHDVRARLAAAGDDQPVEGPGAVDLEGARAALRRTRHLHVV